MKPSKGQPWTPAASPIWTIVCGLPSVKRQRWPLLMLRAYIDDSGQGHGAVLVLAGFISTAERWAEFSDEWQQALDMKPAIRYFKMSEAAGFNGEFHGLSEESRNLKVSRCYRIIEEYAQASIWASIPRDSFAQIFEPVAAQHPVWRNPYYILLFDMIAQFSKNRDLLEIIDSMEFIFDDQMAEKVRVMEAWQFFESDEVDPQVMDIMGNPPKFEDDKRVLPLQAADILAWWTRAKLESRMTGIEAPSFSFKSKKSMPCLSMHWDDASLRRAFAKMFYEGVPIQALMKLGLLA